MQAAKFPASTRAQWEEWTTHWPMSWLAPSASVADPEVALSASEVAEMKAWMVQALQEAQHSEARGGPHNSALIVNPLTGAILMH